MTCSDGATLQLRGTHVGRNVVLKADHGGALRVGRSFVGPGSIVVATEAVTIGDACQIAEMVVVRDQDHVVAEGIPLDAGRFAASPVTIGDRVWIGAKASVLRGVQVGDDAVIGAHAVVTRPVGPRQRWVGIPARQLGS